MLTARRLYIASPDADEIERAFLNEADFEITGASADGIRALEEICAGRPDTVVLDGALIGLDGITALRRLAESAAPPRVAYLRRTPDALPEGIRPDAEARFPYGRMEEIVSLARTAAQSMLPALSMPWAAYRLETAGRFADQLGMRPCLKGRNLVCFGAAALACAPFLASSCRDGLYRYLAEACNTTPRAAERAIRTAAEDTWLRGSLEAIQRLFGMTVDAEKGKPTNKELLTMLAEHVRRETQKAIRRSLDQDG